MNHNGLRPLIVIPARGGSKGIPGKNIRPLAGKPLIAYSIDTARAIAPDSHILLSTDSEEIAEVASRECRLSVPFRRPPELSTDTSGTREVILHAMDYADKCGINYDCIILLQPTSPLRTPDDVRRCMDLYSPEADMVVSVVEASSNPYYNCFETDSNGYLHISKGDGMFTRRQDAPKAWEYNGAVYVINPASIRAKEFGAMTRRIPCESSRERSVDLDTPLDWAVAEVMISHLDSIS